jgi:hypothetical protein
MRRAPELDARNMGNVAVLENHPLREQILEWQKLADQAKKKNEARHRSEPRNWI